MGYSVKVVLDSITEDGHRLTTIQATFPRFILPEVNTHRLFSRNSASSRAIPVARRIEQINSDPFIPEAFGQNKAGMQAGADLDRGSSEEARRAWVGAIDDAVKRAEELVRLDVHKQWANRVIETYAWHTAVITATEWANHDALRCNPAASPEYQTIARMMRDIRADSRPISVTEGYWHMPYVCGADGVVGEDDFEAARKYVGREGRDAHLPLSLSLPKVLRMVSVGRCAAVSYERQESKDFSKDVDRYNKLRASGHMSPFEHVARPMTKFEYEDLFRMRRVVWDNNTDSWWWDGSWTHFCGNVQGWVQERKMIAGEHDFSQVSAATKGGDT